MTKPKHPKSATLAAVRERWTRPPPLTPEERAMLAAAADYPHNLRAEVFCWLWVNHASLSEMLASFGMRPTWEGVARIMATDGVKGRHGAPPTGNAVRRVWGRVCREIEEERRAEEAERQAKQRPARVPASRANVPPPPPAPPPAPPRPPVSWVVPPAPPAPSHSRPPAGEPETAPMTEGQRTSKELLEEFKRRR